MAREVLAQALAEFSKFEADWEATKNTYQFQYEAEAEDAWKKANPKKRLPKEKAQWLASSDVTPIYDTFMATANEMYEEYYNNHKAYQKRFQALAEELKPRTGSDWVMFKFIYGSTYRSAGEHYDAAWRDFRVMTLSLQGVPVRVVETGGGWNVEVQVEDPVVDLAILRYGFKYTIEEAFQWCWCKGVNPRVFWRFVPHDFEEKAGIKYLRPVGEPNFCTEKCTVRVCPVGVVK